jgi:hypothetical protein
MLQSQDPLFSTARKEDVYVAGKSSSGNGSVLHASSIMPPLETYGTGTSFTACPSPRIIPFRNYRGKAPYLLRWAGNFLPGGIGVDTSNPFW